jgi:hypothetical protein
VFTTTIPILYFLVLMMKPGRTSNNAVTVIKTDAKETAAAFIFQIVEWEEVEK